MPKACPVCEGRAPGFFESMCERHFAESERPSSEQIRDAMERGKVAAQQYWLNLSRARRK